MNAHEHLLKINYSPAYVSLQYWCEDFVDLVPNAGRRLNHLLTLSAVASSLQLHQPSFLAMIKPGMLLPQGLCNASVGDVVPWQPPASMAL